MMMSVAVQGDPTGRRRPLRDCAARGKGTVIAFNILSAGTGQSEVTDPHSI